MAVRLVRNNPDTPIGASGFHSAFSLFVMQRKGVSSGQWDLPMDIPGTLVTMTGNADTIDRPLRHGAFTMKEIRLRTYSYRCTCGYELKVFLDSGIPQENCRCRTCGSSLQRHEN